MDNLTIVTGAEAPTWDAAVFFAPEFTLIADHARAGRLLWNPWASGGEPDTAEPQVGAASPITVFLGAIAGGTERGFRVYWLLICFFGPIGILLPARHLGTPPWEAFVIGLSYPFCGLYLGHAGHTVLIFASHLLAFRRGSEFRRVRPALEAGTLWGLAALGGYPAFTILTSTLMYIWALGWCCFTSSLDSDVLDKVTRRGFAARKLC